jgi:hypothetical protein
MSVIINGSAGVTTNSGAVYNGIQGATVQASTSGTSIDFTSIPSWVERITVMFSGVSTNGTSNPIIQIGDSGGIETTGYLGAGGVSTATITSLANFTTGFSADTASTAAQVRHGSYVLTLINSATNLWVSTAVIGYSDQARVSYGGGSKSLSDVLTQVRITTVNGTDTFDAGSINILYE